MKNFIVVMLSMPFIIYSEEIPFYTMLDKLLSDLNAPLIKISDLKKEKSYIFFDARKKVEFEVSHIKNAFHVGESGEKIPTVSKNQEIIVYCSVGYRSGKLVEILRKQGFQAFNLYGGIFDWVYHGNPVVDGQEKLTNRVHTYNKDWSQWLRKGEEVY